MVPTQAGGEAVSERKDADHRGALGRAAGIVLRFCGALAIGQVWETHANVVIVALLFLIWLEM